MIGHSAKLQCCLDAWRQVADGELALDMPSSNCCDMRGAIEIATALSPHVWRITTFVGGEPDTEYRNWKGEWKAYDQRG